MIAPDVGGGFGPKLETLVEHVCVAHAARLLGRPVRYAETRAESMLALPHGRGQVQHVAIGADRDGTITGLDVDILADLGAYPLSPYVGSMTLPMLSGAYAIPAIRARIRSVVTNATPTAPLRGAGRPEAAALVERAVDLLAGELGLDPVAVRRRNLVPPAAFPFRTAVGSTYDSGEYERALDRALALADVADARREQAARRRRGDRRLLGIGVACYVEITTFARPEHAAVVAAEDGAVAVAVGVCPQGQGHETAFAQIASATLGVPLERVRVLHSDTALVARGLGTFASRSLQVAGSACWSRRGRWTSRRGWWPPACSRRTSSTSSGRMIATTCAARRSRRSRSRRRPRAPAGESPPTTTSPRPESTFPFGSHAAVVELDTETGDLRVLRLVGRGRRGPDREPAARRGPGARRRRAGDRAGAVRGRRVRRRRQPAHVRPDQLRIPSAADLPRFATERTETPTPVNPLGAKGIGESGAVGATPAVRNAAVDALAHLGVRHLELPLSPERLWRAARDAAADLPRLLP